jgi:hypothetical protein
MTYGIIARRPATGPTGIQRARRAGRDDLDLADRVRAELVFELPSTLGASLGRWLGCAAVVAEVGAEGVVVRARANRVFRLGDLAELVREWMQAHAVDVVFARCDGGLLSITTDELRR